MHNNRLPASEISLLAAAAEKAEISPARVDILRPPPDEVASAPPLFLLAGLSAGMDLLLQELAPFAGTRAASQTEAESVSPTGPRHNPTSVIIGADARAMAPRLGNWSVLPGGVPARGALVAVSAHPDFPSQAHAAIASWPRFERGFIVTQTSQPLGQAERQLLRLMASHCVEIGVLYLCYRGDDIDDVQLAELRKFAASEAARAGISFAGYLDASLYTLKNKDAALPNTDVFAQYRFTQPATEVAETDFIHKARKGLIQELLQKLPDSARNEISPKDQSGIKERFERYLNSVGERLPHLMHKKKCTSSNDIRKLYIEEMDGWQNKSSVEGSTMYHLETLAPGTLEEFHKQIRLSSDNLELVVQPKPFIQHVRRYAVPLWTITSIWGFLAGSLVTWYYLHYTGAFKDDARMLLLQIAPWLAMALLISMYLYIHGRTIMRASPPQLQDEREKIDGWPGVMNQMLNWLEHHLQTPAQDLKKDILKLRV